MSIKEIVAALESARAELRQPFSALACNQVRLIVEGLVAASTVVSVGIDPVDVDFFVIDLESALTVERLLFNGSTGEWRAYVAAQKRL